MKKFKRIAIGLIFFLLFLGVALLCYKYAGIMYHEGKLYESDSDLYMIHVRWSFAGLVGTLFMGIMAIVMFFKAPRNFMKLD